MRHDASATTVGSTQRRTGVGNILRGASVAVAFAMLALAFAAPAGAATFQRPFKEIFGPVAKPTVTLPGALVVDPATGDLLVAEPQSGTLLRFHSDGTPAPFEALGVNKIDGKGGPKPCAEEPASCDKTPQNHIALQSVANGGQIAIDNSGGLTDGNIYVTHYELVGAAKSLALIDIFASDGTYLGQITAAGLLKINKSTGVAVDGTGAVYVAGNVEARSGGVIAKYVPTANPPVNADNTALFSTGLDYLVSLSVGAGPTSGYIFGVGGSNQLNRLAKIDAVTGEQQYGIGEGEERQFNSASVVDPTTGRVLATSGVVSKGGVIGGEVLEFDASGSSNAILTARFEPKNELAPGKPASGQSGLAANLTGEIYVSASVPGFQAIEVFGLPAITPTVEAEAAGGVTGTKAVLTGSVNAEGSAVSECVFEYGTTTKYGSKVPCEGDVPIPPDSNDHAVHANLSGLLPDGTTYHFRLAAENENGTERSFDKIFTTASTVVTEAAGDIGLTSATLHGTLRPEGEAFSACHFEYGLASSASFEGKAPCEPPAAAIESDFDPHAVSLPLNGLEEGAAYRFRVVATNSKGTRDGGETTFTTLGAPRITEVRARDANQSSATLEATINPSGFGTSYYFEWGPTTAYGNRVPADFELPVGGAGALQVNVQISGLVAGANYHYRVVARSSAGTTKSPDHLVETLNFCGLPDQRCFELVSPRDVSPSARPGATLASLELHFQAATQPGSLAYVVEGGLQGATKGAEVLYRGTRSPSGWQSAQLSSPFVEPPQSGSGGSNPGMTLGLSPDLSCSVLEAKQALTADPKGRLVLEAGGSNLYRRNPDGSFTLISNLPPENPEAGATAQNGFYGLVGFSADCSRIYFTTAYRYPGVVGGNPAADKRLYEWVGGELHGVDLVPGPSGEVAVQATPGGTDIAGAQQVSNAVSDDGSRVFFTASRQTSPIPGEIGKPGVFVRENGITRDISLSQTSTPDNGANYQHASADGSKAFFIANAGLTADSSSAGNDLYQYDLRSETLTDLSVDHDPGGAAVAGVLGASEDGSVVYFAARGQLVPGKGRTLSGNEAADTFSIYRVAAGAVAYVGVVDARDMRRVTVSPRFTSRVSPDGRFLLFESSVNFTGYENGTVPQFYLYDAAAGEEKTTCISCRQDGEPSLTPNGNGPIASGDRTNPLSQLRTLAVKSGQPQVFFTSFDRLAAGAVEGRSNLYQWSHDQIFHIATEPPGQTGPATEIVNLPGFFEKEEAIRFVGSSSDGTDLYFVTPESLNWEDVDGRTSVYDARVGGGFAQPLAPPSPCDPMSESTGSCQDGSPGGGPTAPPLATPTFQGPGNAKPQKQGKHRRKHKKHRKHRRHGKKQSNGKHGKAKAKKKSKRARHANGNRRAGK